MDYFRLSLVNHMHHSCGLRLGLVLMLFLFGNPSRGEVRLNENSKHVYIGLQTKFWKDSSGSTAFKDILLLTERGVFVESKQQVPNFGFTSSNPVYWATFDIQKQSGGDYILDLGFGNMAYVDFYFMNTSGTIVHHHLGDFLGKKGREIGYHGYAVKLPSWTQQRIFLRIQPYSGQALFPLAIWESQAFNNANQELTLMWGLYLGILITVLIYHLIFYWRTREEGFGRLSLYLFLYLGFECSRGLGLGPRYFWYSNITLIHYAAYFFSTVSLLAFLEFYAYVTLAKRSPRLRIAVRGVQVACASLGMVAYFTTAIGQNQLMYYDAILGGFCVIIISLNAIFQGNRIGWYYLLAGISIYTGTFIQSAQRAGVFEGLDSLILRYAMNFGSLTEIILLSLGVAETARQEKSKRRQAEAQTELEIKARSKIVEKAEVTAKQQEQKRMAIELHNNIGNTLLVLNNSLSQMNLPDSDSSPSLQLKDVTEISKQLYERVRTLSHSYALSTASTLQTKGLDVALKELVTNQNRFGTSPHFLYRMQGSDLLLSETLQFELYNICTELINNILKHAKATTASIMIEVNNNEVILVVADNGIGMPTMVLEGFGLQHLRQRAKKLEATLDIRSEEGERCEISMVLPIGDAS